MSEKSKTKSPIRLDERNVAIIRKICTVLYLVTILLIQGAIHYRSLILNQNSQQYEDLNIILTVNVVLFIILALYFGGVSIGKIKFRIVLLLYGFLVIAGTVFTIIKYKLDTIGAILGKLVIIASIGAILIVLWVVFAFLGKRKAEKDIE